MFSLQSLVRTSKRESELSDEQHRGSERGNGKEAENWGNNEGKGRSGRDRRGRKLKAVALMGLNQVQLCLI